MSDDVEKARRAVERWHLGQTSSHYESSGKGADVISTGKGDHGGVSYGAYQLSTKMGTLQEYLDQSSYGAKFKGLTPAAPAFDAKWRELARTDPGFAKDQHDFIGKSHYNEQNDRLRERGVDLSNRGRAVQDALWSTAVQFRNITTRIFAKGLEEKFGTGFDLSKLSDKEVVEAAQDYKISHNSALFKSSPEWWPGLLKRANAEKVDLAQLATHEEVLKVYGIDIGLSTPASRISQPVQVSNDARSPPHRDAMFVQAEAMAYGLFKQGERSSEIRGLQQSLNELGFRDAQGRALVEDADFGRRTKEAVEAFQRANGLKVDGIAGPETLTRIGEHLPRRGTVAGTAEITGVISSLADRNHLDHPLYQQAYDGLKQLDPQKLDFRSEQEYQNAAGTLAFEAKVSGLQRIDHVVANRDSSGLFVVSGALDNPAHHRIYVDRAQAAQQPIERSTQKLEHTFPQQQSQPDPVQQDPTGTARRLMTI